MQAKDLARELNGIGFDPIRTLSVDFDYEVCFGEPALPVALRELGKIRPRLVAMERKLNGQVGQVTELEDDRLEVLRLTKSLKGQSQIIREWAVLLRRFEQVGPLAGAGRFLGEEGLRVLATMEKVLEWGSWLGPTIGVIAQHQKKGQKGLRDPKVRLR